MKIRVRLTEDLTKYGEGLIPGLEGYSIGAYGTWSKAFDRFTTVVFDNNVTLDVLWKGLEIIDEEYLRIEKAKKDKELSLLHTAYEIEYLRGPGWGFKLLSFKIDGLDEYSNSKYIYDEKEADEYVKKFKECGLEVRVITEKSAKQLQLEEELRNSRDVVVTKSKRGALKLLTYKVVDKFGNSEDKTVKSSDAIRSRLNLIKDLGLNLDIKEKVQV